MTVTFYVFNLAIICLHPRRHYTYATALFVNTAFSDNDNILIKNYISWRDIMRDSWEKNFRTKDGRKVTLTGCSRSSETQAQWTDVRAAADAKCPHGWKHWPGEQYGSEFRGPAPNSQHSPWNITGDKHS